MFVDCESDLHYVLKVYVGKRNARPLASLFRFGLRNPLLFKVRGMFIGHLDLPVQPIGCFYPAMWRRYPKKSIGFG
jgi:hypothetical protein